MAGREEPAWVQTLTSWMSAEAGKWTADEWLVWFEGLDEENQRKWKEVHSDYPHCFDFDVKDGSAELLHRSLGLFLPGSSSRGGEAKPPAAVTREAPLLEVAEAEAAAEAAAEEAARAAALAEEEAKKVLRQAFEEMAAGSKRKEPEDSGLSNIPAAWKKLRVQGGSSGSGDMATAMTPPPSKAVRPPPMLLQGPAFQPPPPPPAVPVRLPEPPRPPAPRAPPAAGAEEEAEQGRSTKLQSGWQARTIALVAAYRAGDWSRVNYLCEKFCTDQLFAERLRRHQQFVANNGWDPQYDY